VPLTQSDRHVHHHGLLAGVGAGTAAVLVAGLLILGVWHRVSGTVGAAVTVIVWAFAAAVLAAALYVVGCLALRLIHHAAHPETLTRHSLRAEVIPGKALAADESPALPAPAPVAALPSPAVNHWHLSDPETAAAVIRAATEGTTERN
jgi:hypothetical protein